MDWPARGSRPGVAEAALAVAVLIAACDRGPGEADPGTVRLVELFDHAADRLNLHDVAADHPRIVERLTAELERWHQWALERRLPETEREEELTSEEREQLRALGYLD